MASPFEYNPSPILENFNTHSHVRMGDPKRLAENQPFVLQLIIDGREYTSKPRSNKRDAKADVALQWLRENNKDADVEKWRKPNIPSTQPRPIPTRPLPISAPSTPQNDTPKPIPLSPTELESIPLKNLSLANPEHTADKKIWFDQWEVIKPLAKPTGQSQCYLVRDKGSSQRFCLKCYVPRAHERGTEKERMERESNCLIKLAGVEGIPVFKCNKSTDKPYIVMQYIEGQTLSDFCKKNPPTVEQMLEIINKLLDVVQECHSLGIVHRDIKPQNIMITGGKDVFLLDFGISYSTNDNTLTNEREAPGPQLCRFSVASLSKQDKRDQRIDVGLVCAVFISMLTGLPFMQPHVNLDHCCLVKEKFDKLAVMEIIKHVPHLIQIFTKGVHSDTDRRFDSCLELQEFFKRPRVLVKERSEFLRGSFSDELHCSFEQFVLAIINVHFGSEKDEVAFFYQDLRAKASIKDRCTIIFQLHWLPSVRKPVLFPFYLHVSMEKRSRSPELVYETIICDLPSFLDYTVRECAERIVSNIPSTSTR